MTERWQQVWTRQRIEEAAAEEPEGRTMFRCLISPKMLKLLMDYGSEHGDRIELISAYGDPERCELRFYRRDVPVPA